NVEIIHADILSLILSLTKLSFPHLNDVKAYKVVANLPYYISSPVIQKFLYGEFRPERMVLLLQKEVAQRICAKPPRMSLLAVSVQYAADPKIVAFVKRGSFWPAPKVDSAILRITPKKSVPPKKEVEEFFRVARAGFSNPRKQILGNLSTGLRVERITMEKILKDAGISFSRRAETLSVAEWASLATSCGNLSET
ncbi:MAG: rRNA adenine dimethyltransferase family protein, partial [Candidatus Yanofskybacteria bacterium]|nr:rRNA adenine dimethyltransferase family protein [Candidatus Yanofskybacteria bacterium]